MIDVMKIIRGVEEESKKISITREELAGMIDHTNLSAYTTKESIKKLCDEAENYGFHSVTINPYYTKLCGKHLEGKNIAINPVVGFPLGQTTTEVKVFETKKAIEDGAKEIDMVMNIGGFRDKDYDFVKKDIEAVVNAADKKIVKVIIETSYLTYEEVIKASEIVKKSGADYVKNGTGFGAYGSNIPHIYLMRKAVGEDFGVKAAGGIHSFRDAARMVAAGADRIGASGSLGIMDSYEKAGPEDWEIGEDFCSLCPAEMVSADEVPVDVFRYYKSFCEDCFKK